VPTQIATADTTKNFFGALVRDQRLVSFFNLFEIRQWFPATDDRNPFGLLTIGSHTPDPEFAFSLTAIAQLAETERRFTLSADDIARINPNTKTAPVFRSGADAELTAKIYGRVPVLIEEGKGPTGNLWGAEFRQGLFNMTSDSGLFRTAVRLRDAGFERDGSDWVTREGVQPRQGALNVEGSDRRSVPLAVGADARGPERWVPLYEAKLIHQFDHRWATYDGADSRDATAAEKADTGFEPTPRYWVPESEVADRLAAKNWTRRWLMGWRDICRSTDERTVIAAVFPQVGTGNKIPLVFPDRSVSPPHAAALVGCLSSLALDYSARQKIGGTSLTYFYLKQFPVLPPSAYTAADVAFLVPRVLELCYTSWSLAPFARDLGYDGPPFAWDEDRRALLRAELDAWYARAYGLIRDELRYILDPADVRGPDYPSETFRVLKKNEIARWGDYRTARLVLAAWDAQEARPAAAQ
jgi:hypothetical protein